MKIISQPNVVEKIRDYPEQIREKLLFLRQLILKTALEMDGIGRIEESLKWGQPSYRSKRGSTIRIDRVSAESDQYAVYFHCQTSLVETFRELYAEQFNYDGKRAILFSTDDEIPIPELKHCIALALNYHRVKHLPLLGA